MKIQYVGPFWKVEAEGISFTRYTTVTVDAAVGAKLLKQVDSSNKALFVDTEAVVAAESEAEEAPVVTDPVLVGSEG